MQNDTKKYWLIMRSDKPSRMNWTPNYFVSGFIHPQLPIVKHDGIFLYEWGLIPFWIKDHTAAKNIQNMTLNAVGETIFEKPSFRNSITTKRCLLGINGFYEWRNLTKVKYPYFIHTKSGDLFSLEDENEMDQTNLTTAQINELKRPFPESDMIIIFTV